MQGVGWRRGVREVSDGLVDDFVRVRGVFRVATRAESCVEIASVRKDSA